MALDVTNTGNLDAGNNIKVTLPTSDTYAGKVRIMSENDAASNYLKSPETSLDYRLRVGIDTISFSDTFNGTAQNTGIWSYAATTLTATQPGGYLQIGTVQGTASGHGAYMRTQRYFQLIGASSLSIEVTAGMFTAALAANEAVYFGFGLPSAGQTIPTDGAYFKITSGGAFGCVAYSGVETSTTVFSAAMTLATMKKFTIVVGEREVEFWIDDVYQNKVAIPAANGQPFITGSLPAFLQKITTGVVANTNVVRVSDVTVTLMDITTNIPASAQQNGQGQNIYQIQNGTAISGPLTFFAANAYPTTALPIGTGLTANLPNLIGGMGLATLWNLAATDMVLQQWLNPVGTTNITGRTLFITGVTISASSATAAWTGPAAGVHIFQWSIAFGHTATTMATITDSASFAAAGTTKGVRRRPVGSMSYTTGATPVGTMPDRGDLNVAFRSPLVINPGEYLTTVCRMMNGAVTATGGQHFMIGFDGYFA